jgi:hypothetical protein
MLYIYLILSDLQNEAISSNEKKRKIVLVISCLRTVF